jgi:molecular chaperone GrpE
MSNKKGEKINKPTEEEINTTESTGINEEISEDFCDEVITITDEAPKKTEAEEYKELAQRVQAEFDNYRRRNNEAVRQARIDATDDTLAEFFTVLDNLERGIKNVTDEKAKSGMELIYKQIQSIMDKHEVVEIIALDTDFDPISHHAVAQCENSEKTGKVVEVYQKGYARNKKILRPAMVKVAQ